MPIRKQVCEFGLNNEDGLFNCFLNVCIQSIWHVESMRKALISFSEKDSDGMRGEI